MENICRIDPRKAAETAVCLYLYTKEAAKDKLVMREFKESLARLHNDHILKVIYRKEEFNIHYWRGFFFSHFIDAPRPPSYFDGWVDKIERIELKNECSTLTSPEEYEDMMTAATASLKQLFDDANKLTKEELDDISRETFGEHFGENIGVILDGETFLEEFRCSEDEDYKTLKVKASLLGVDKSYGSIVVYEFDGRAFLSTFRKIPEGFECVRVRRGPYVVMNIVSAINTVLSSLEKKK